jgi:hypothetical protein
MTLANDDGTKLLDDPSTTASDWPCTKCVHRLQGDPETTLLGGYGRGRCSECEKSTVWVSAERKAMLRDR